MIPGHAASFIQGSAGVRAYSTSVNTSDDPAGNGAYRGENLYKTLFSGICLVLLVAGGLLAGV